MSLSEWLEDVNLKQYLEKITDLGASTVEDLRDIVEEDISELGMRPLEARRFQRKLDILKSSTSSQSIPVVSHVQEKITTNMPCPDLLGRKTIDIPKAELIKEYGELYYNTDAELNFKQRMSNGFILNMMASAHWRFDSKRKLEDWAREERMRRLKYLLKFSSKDMLKNETKHFQEQNIYILYDDLLEKYKDIVSFLDLDTLDPENRRHKHTRVDQFATKLETLYESAIDELKGIEERGLLIAKSQGRKEEEDFWKGMLKTARACEALLQSKLRRAQEAQFLFTEKLGASRPAAETGRKKGKNSAKTLRHKAERQGRKKGIQPLHHEARPYKLHRYFASAKKISCVYVPPIHCRLYKYL